MPASNLPVNPPKLWDVVLGMVFCTCTLLGVSGNLLAYIHFYTRDNKRANSRYFTRLYCVISLVDLVICTMQFPIIQSLFAKREGNSENLLFKDSAFCAIWTILTMATLMLSVFMVAMLAVSRLILILRPRLQLPPLAPWIIPGIYLVLVLVVGCGVPLWVHYVAIAYNPNKGVCVMYGTIEGFDYNKIDKDTLLTKLMLQKDFVKKIIWSSLMAAPILPILMCALVSVFKLKKV